MPKEKSRAQVNGPSLLVCMQGMVIMLSTLIAKVNRQPCEPMNPPNSPFVIENVHGENRFRVHKFRIFSSCSTFMIVIEECVGRAVSNLSSASARDIMASRYSVQAISIH